MRIVGQQIHMRSERKYEEHYSRQERLEVWSGERSGNPTERTDAQLAISEQARSLYAQTEQSAGVKEQEKVLFELSDEDKLKIRLIEKMMEVWTGKKFKIEVLSKLAVSGDEQGASSPQLPGRGQSAGANWGMIYESHELYVEREQTKFEASGTIRLEDGRELAFHTRIELSRSYRQETSVHIRAGQALQDPLVLNFGGGTSQFSGSGTALDLDGDGREEWIPLFQQGSGYLVFDRNEDGQVNDGSELFGPKTGNGFAELRQLDSDGNGWIDAGDEAFGQLYLWVADDNGQPVLEKLERFKIGALYTDSIATPFAYKDGQNELLAQLRSTGLFVKQNGTVGTLQQIDLKV